LAGEDGDEAACYDECGDIRSAIVQIITLESTRSRRSQSNGASPVTSGVCPVIRPVCGLTVARLLLWAVPAILYDADCLLNAMVNLIHTLARSIAGWRLKQTRASSAMPLRSSVRRALLPVQQRHQYNLLSPGNPLMKTKANPQGLGGLVKQVGNNH